MTWERLTEDFRRLSRDGKHVLFTQSGGCSDEANWQYPVTLSADEQSFIDRSLHGLVPSYTSNTWCIEKFNGRYLISRITWRFPWWADSLDEAIEKIKSNHHVRTITA